MQLTCPRLIGHLQLSAMSASLAISAPGEGENTATTAGGDGGAAADSASQALQQAPVRFADLDPMEKARR
jgi:hypothetical protein